MIFVIPPSAFLSIEEVRRRHERGRRIRVGLMLIAMGGTFLGLSLGPMVPKPGYALANRTANSAVLAVGIATLCRGLRK